MHVKVCYGCPLRFQGKPYSHSPKDRCEILSAKLAGVRGIGLRSIDFDCQTKLDLFQPGQGVTFLGTVGRDYEGNATYGTFRGFVFKWAGNNVRVVSEQTDRPFVTIRPTRLNPTGERRRVCIYCGMPEGVTVQVKDKYSETPHKWVCRTDFTEEGEAELQCEYPPSVESPQGGRE